MTRLASARRLPALFLGSTLLIAFLLLEGCTAHYATIPGVAVHSEMRFQRNDYEILQTATAEGCATFVSLFPIPIFMLMHEKSGSDLYAYDVGGRSREIAVYKAIQDTPNADAIILPRFHDTTTNAGIWYSRTCSTVSGKAIRFKTDKQLNGELD